MKVRSIFQAALFIYVTAGGVSPLAARDGNHPAKAKAAPKEKDCTAQKP